MNKHYFSNISLNSRKYLLGTQFNEIDAQFPKYYSEIHLVMYT